MLFPNKDNSYWLEIDIKQIVFENKKKTSYIKS